MADVAKGSSTTQLWPMLHEQRRKVADMLSTLSDQEWDAPSLCSGWRVRDVVAHCIEINLMTPGRFFGKFIGTGFRFHAMNAAGVAQHASQSPQQLLQEYRETAPRTTTPPGPKMAMLAEAVIHGEDMARPSGKHIDVSPEALVAVATFTRASSPLLHGKQRSAGLQLRTTDVDWTAGDGPEVSGPAASIILAITGRRAGLDGLTGQGVETLRSRI
jgi:uncharacterized protein (TIGR03083 family)